VHRFKVTLASDGKAGFDHVDFEPRQLPRHLQLFAKVHRRARALLAIAQGRVENYDSITFHKTSAVGLIFQIRATKPRKTKTPPPFGSGVLEIRFLDHITQKTLLPPCLPAERH
jgi:hypothetical protein